MSRPKNSIDARTQAARRHRAYTEAIVHALSPSGAETLDVFTLATVSRLATMLLMAEDADRELQNGGAFSPGEYCQLFDRIKSTCKELGVTYRASGGGANGGPVQRRFRMGTGIEQDLGALENYIAAKYGNGRQL